MAKFNNQFATQKLRQEMSVTGTGAGMTPSTVNNPATQDWYTTKNKKKVKKEEKDVEPKLAAGKAKVYMKNKWGWKDAPSIPNRPSKGGFIYNQIFEGPLEERSINEALEVGNRVKVIYGNNFYGQTGIIDDIISGFVKVKMDRDGRVYDMHSSDVEKIEDEPVSDYSKYRQDPDYYEKDYQEKGTSDYFQRRALDEENDEPELESGDKVQVLRSSGLVRPGAQITGTIHDSDGDNEFLVILDAPQHPMKRIHKDHLKFISRPDSNFSSEEQDDDEDSYDWFTNKYIKESYSKFKNETKTRGKADQFHQAVRQVRQKVQEINRLFEYVSRLKSELSEGEGGLKYKVHTEKALAKIKEMVSELNQNIKKFK